MSSSQRSQWILGAAGLVAAAGIGRWTADTAPAPVREIPRTAETRVITVPSAAPRESIDRVALRAEIGAAVRAAAATEEDEAEPVEVVLPAEAAQLISGAIGRAAMTDADWRALDELTMQISPEESYEAFRQISVAINSGQIKRVAPPFAAAGSWR